MGRSEGEAREASWRNKTLEIWNTRGTFMIRNIIQSNRSAYLTDLEVQEIRFQDAKTVSPELIDILHLDKDPSHSSRAFHALMILENFDQLSFLIDFYEGASSEWKWVCLGSLAKFNHPKAIAKLCDVLLNSREPELKLAAAESLEILANLESLFALKFAKDHDTSQDFNGASIAFAASKAIKKIDLA